MTTPDGRPRNIYSDQDTYSDTDAQQHPKGNVQDRIESPGVGLPVDDGEPSGEQNSEEQGPNTSEADEREED